MTEFDGLKRLMQGDARGGCRPLLRGMALASLLIWVALPVFSLANAARDPFLPVIGEKIEDTPEPDEIDPFANLHFVGFVQPLSGGGKSVAAISEGGSHTLLKHAGESFMAAEGQDFLLKAATLTYVDVLHKPSRAMRRLPLEALDVQQVSAAPDKPNQKEMPVAPNALSNPAPSNMPSDGTAQPQPAGISPNPETQKAIDKVLSGVKP